MNHNVAHIIDVIFLAFMGPPSSAPMFGLKRRYINMPIQIKASTQNTSTEKPSDPGSTTNLSPLSEWYTAATDQASPIPKNTFTEFEPVTLPIDESAVSSFIVATLLAKVSKGERYYIIDCFIINVRNNEDKVDNWYIYLTVEQW